MTAGIPKRFDAYFTADSYGIERVLVNGQAVIINGQFTGATPGTVLKSGKDTYTVLP